VSRAAPLALLAALAGPAAADELQLSLSGRVQSDLQLRLEEKAAGDFYDRAALPPGVERAQATLGLRLDAAFGRWKGVAQVDLVYDGFALPLTGVGDLYHIEKIDPFRLEAQSLYLDVKELLPGLDLRVGQQVVSWGVGDQFNPTNNLNPDDIRDKLLFGRQIGNFMVRADWWPAEELSISGVLVPLFKPALLPRSAALGPLLVDRLPFVDDFFRWRIEAEQAATASSVIRVPTTVERATPVVPPPTFENLAASLRVAATLGGQDVALSFYEGRFDFPVPLANHTRFDPSAAGCDPADETRCIVGLLRTSVELGFPRMSVVGLNAAGEIPLSWIAEGVLGLGYRLEAALVLPARSTVTITNDFLALPIEPQPAGEYDYDDDGVPGGPRPATIEDTPYAKWVLGLDYTFGEHVYVNAQWVHGFPDEHGAGDFLSEGRAVRASGVTTDDGGTLVLCALPRDGTKCATELTRPRIADYLVVGVDLRFSNNAGLLRLFSILDLSGVVEERFDLDAGRRVKTRHSAVSPLGFSAIVYPELNYNLGSGLDLGAGALLQLGKVHTKFGDPAAGGSLVWARARLAF
jgi:hypothetical protein